ncbi:hypothetical protein GGR57DRAFT_500357 [Xylariaceae sp. FL1272]|nr:hypothetical protein GGR57DRAFT_500357 [Xylariaceae sp. FL1272]
MPEKLREIASKKVNGPNANPSQLGDPISVKAETSDYVPPTEEGESAKPQPVSKPATEESSDDKETLREKASKKLHGSGANPSQLGDPISMKNETTDGVPVERESGAEQEDVTKRESKL